MHVRRVRSFVLLTESAKRAPDVRPPLLGVERFLCFSIIGDSSKLRPHGRSKLKSASLCVDVVGCHPVRHAGENPRHPNFTASKHRAVLILDLADAGGPWRHHRAYDRRTS